jgi:hypothetical protein
MTGAGLLCLAGWGSVLVAEDRSALVTPHLKARDSGQVGEVAGSALAGSRTPTGAPVPYESVAVMLLPYSPAFEGELTGIKAAQRSSLRSYVEAAKRLEAARKSYEQELLAVGAGELIRGEVSTGNGRFWFGAVPAGQWLLLAWRSTKHATPGRKIQRREAGRFVDNVERAGHVSLTYWLVRLEVSAGETVHMTLTDRNGWMTGVREELRPPEPVGDASRRSQGTTR